MILSIYELKETDKDISKRTIKKLGKLNNTYYEIVTPQMTDMSFKETLLFLENASVLGISKRKVCKLIMDKGFEGL
jgi:hypothetical protein